MRMAWRWMILGGLLGSSLVDRHVQAAPGGAPLEQIRQTVETVLTVLRDPALQGPAHVAERRLKLRQTILQRFGFAEMAQRALGPHWRQRTPAERQEFVTLFSDLLAYSYLDKIASYTGEQNVLYGKETIDLAGYAVVDTAIVSPYGMPVDVSYRLLRRDTAWQVYDVVIEGVSLVNNYRTQFNNIIIQESYSGLVKRLKLKHAQEQAITPTAG
jgi:phospholipid transport system substrate-binding protein